jgi:hypothetical protein
MEAHTARSKDILDLSKILTEKKVELDGREQYLELCTALLAEAQPHRVNPRDNHDELMEFIELQRLLRDVEVDCVIEASRLAALVGDASQVLENLGMPLSRGSPGIRVRLATS